MKFTKYIAALALTFILPFACTQNDTDASWKRSVAKSAATVVGVIAGGYCGGITGGLVSEEYHKRAFSYQDQDIVTKGLTTGVRLCNVFLAIGVGAGVGSIGGGALAYKVAAKFIP